MRLVLVRHGRTDWNREFRVQGHSDIPLNSTGKIQAEAISNALQGEKVGAVYSSPLSRAYWTAQAIARSHQVEVLTDDRLKELDVGTVDGLYYPRLKTDTPEFYNLWMADPASARWPNGESLSELDNRVWGFIDSINQNEWAGSVIIISHLFSIVTILCRVLGMDLAKFRNLNLSVASISIVELNSNQSQLKLFNDTCHLDSMA